MTHRAPPSFASGLALVPWPGLLSVGLFLSLVASVPIPIFMSCLLGILAAVSLWLSERPRELWRELGTVAAADPWIAPTSVTFKGFLD